MPGQKVAEKRIARVKPATNAKTVASSPATIGLPQLVLSEQVSTLAANTEMAVAVNVALPPVLVMPEGGGASSAVTLAANETSVDDSHEEAVRASTETDVPAPNETIMESTSVSGADKPTFLQALAVQWRSLWRTLTRTWIWTQQKLKSHQVRKRLRVCETVSLGEKRFVAVIQVDGEQFLVGGSSSSVSTLAHLEPRREFSEVFRSRCEQDLSQA